MVEMLLAFLAHFSLLGLGAAGLGAGLLALAFFGLTILPPFLVRPVIGLGVVMVVAGAIYSLAWAKATHAEQVRTLEHAQAAEAARRAASERIASDLAKQIVRDAAELDSSNRKRKALEDDLATRTDRDRVCVPRDLSRRLRDL